MRLARLLTGLALAGLVACESASSPKGPSLGDLDGQWGWTFNGNPGGAYMTLTLATAGTGVSGNGEVCGVGAFCNPGAVTVSGQHASVFGPFTLTLSGAGRWVATYAGEFVGKDQVQGTWTQGSQSNTVTLDRCSAGGSC